MDPGKLKSLVNFINSLGVGECIESLEQLKDGEHFCGILRIICGNNEASSFDHPIQRYSCILKFLEGFYQSSLKYKVDCSQIVNNASKGELAKVTTLLLCAAIQGERVEFFVEAITKLDLLTQNDIKEIIEFIVVQARNHTLRPDFADILHRKGNQPAMSLSECGITASNIPPGDSGISGSPVPTTTHQSSTDPVSPFVRPGPFANSPMSPVKMLINSPHMVNKINNRKLYDNIRSLESKLASETALRQDMESELEERNAIINKKDSQLRDLNAQVKELKKLKDEVDELKAVEQELKKSQREVTQLKKMLERKTDLKMDKAYLERQNEELLSETHHLKSMMKDFESIKTQYEGNRVQLRRSEVNLGELHRELCRLQQELECALRARDEATRTLEESQQIYKERIGMMEEQLLKQASTPNEGESLGIIVEQRVTELELELQKLRTTWASPEVHKELKNSYNEVCQAKQAFEDNFTKTKTELLQTGERCNSLSHDLKQSQEENWNLAHASIQLNTRITDLERNLESAKQTEESLTSGLESVTGEKNALSGEVAQLKAELGVKGQELEAHRQAMETQRAELMGKVDTQHASNARLQEELNILTRDSTQQVREMADQIQELKTKAESEQSNLSAQLQLTQDNLRTAREDLKNERMMFEKRIEVLKEEMITAVSKGQDAETSLKSELLKNQQETDELKKMLVSLGSELENEKKTNEEIRQLLEGEKSGWMTTREMMKENQRKLEDELSSKVQEIDAVTMQMKTMNDDFVSRECAKDETIKNLTEKQEELLRNIETLQDEKEKLLTEKNDETQQHNAEMDAFTSQVEDMKASLRNRNNELETELLKVIEESKKMKALVEDQQTETDDLRRKLEVNAETIRNQTEKEKKLLGNIQTLRQEKETQLTKIDEAYEQHRAEIDQLTAQIEEIKTSAISRNSELEAEVRELSEKSRRMKAEMDLKEMEMDNAKRILERDAETQKERASLLESEIEKLKNEIMEMKGSHQQEMTKQMQCVAGVKEEMLKAKQDAASLQTKMGEKVSLLETEKQRVQELLEEEKAKNQSRISEGMKEFENFQSQAEQMHGKLLEDMRHIMSEKEALEIEVARLKAKVETQAAEFQKEVEDFKKASEEEKSTLKQCNNEAILKLAKSSSELEHTQSELEAVRNELHALKGSVAKTTGESTALAGECEILRTRLSQAAAEQGRLQTVCEKLEKDLGVAGEKEKASGQWKDEATQQIKSLEEKLKSTSEQQHALEKSSKEQVLAKEKEIQSLTEVASTRIKALENALRQSQETGTALEKASKEQALAKEKEIQSLKEEASTRIKALENALRQSQETGAALEKASGNARESTRKEMDALREEHEMTVNDIRERYNSEITILQRGAQARQDLLQQKLDDVSSELERVKADYQRETEAARQRSLLAETTRDDRLSTIQRDAELQVKSLKRSIDRRSANISKLQTELEEKKRAEREAVAKAAEMQRLLEDTRLDCSIKISDAEQSKAKMEEQMRSLHKETKEAREQLSLERISRDTLSQRVRSLEAQVAFADKQLREMSNSGHHQHRSTVTPTPANAVSVAPLNDAPITSPPHILNTTRDISPADHSLDSLDGLGVSQTGRGDEGDLRLDDLKSDNLGRSDSVLSLSSTGSNKSTRSTRSRTRIEITLSGKRTSRSTSRNGSQVGGASRNGSQFGDFGGSIASSFQDLGCSINSLGAEWPDNVARTLDQLEASRGELTASTRRETLDSHRTTGPSGFFLVGSCVEEPDHMEWDDRLAELQRRNTLCHPHLKTSYPVEIQTRPMNEISERDLQKGQEEPTGPASRRYSLRSSAEGTGKENMAQVKPKTSKKRTSDEFQFSEPMSKHLRSSVSQQSMPPPPPPNSKDPLTRWAVSYNKGAVDRTTGAHKTRVKKTAANQVLSQEVNPRRQSIAYSVGFSPKKTSRRKSMRMSLAKKASAKNSPKPAPNMKQTKPAPNMKQKESARDCPKLTPSKKKKEKTPNKRRSMAKFFGK